MHGQRADGKGHWVELGVNQHGGYCGAGKDRTELILNGHIQHKNNKKLLLNEII
jgi:hypothetical protein